MRSPAVALGVILLVAIALRVAWLSVFNEDPANHSDDSVFYHGVAQALSDGRGYNDPVSSQPSAQWPPGYSAVLALAYLVPGDNLLTAKAVNVALALVSIVLVYVVASRLFGSPAGLIAALLLAVFPSYVFLSTLVFSENLFVPAVLLVVSLLALWGLRDRPPTWLESLSLGAAIGFSAMVRSEGIWLIAPAGVVWLLASRGWRASLRNGLFVAAGVAVLLAPWTVRNVVQLDEYSPLRSASTGVLNVGLNPEYRAYGPIPPEVPLPTISDDLRYYSERPWRWLHFFRDKQHDLFNNDSALLYHIDLGGYDRWHGPADGVYFGLGIIALTGMVVLVLNRDRGGLLLAGVLLTWTLGMALVYPEPRYHMALVPLLVILAGAAIGRVPAGLHAGGSVPRRLQHLAPGAALVAGLALGGATMALTYGDEVDISSPAPLAFDAPVGAQLRLGALEVAARDFAFDSAGTVAVPEGHTALTVDVVVRNAGLADVIVFEAQATVEDAQGNSYLPVARPEAAGSLTGDLPPGVELTASPVYVVPLDEERLEFVYTPLGIRVQGRWLLE